MFRVNSVDIEDIWEGQVPKICFPSMCVGCFIEFWGFYRTSRVFGCFLGFFVCLFVLFWPVFVFLLGFRGFYLTMGVAGNCHSRKMYFGVFRSCFDSPPKIAVLGYGFAATNLGDYKLWACYIILRFFSVLFCIWWVFFAIGCRI